jgi:peptidoglycan/xylan/chitin deacetylase (PgdA/CDA1 family)
MYIKDLAKQALLHSGFYKYRCAIKTIRDKRLLILMYHDLIRSKDDSSLAQTGYGRLTETEFESHLDAISRCCRIITVEEAVGEIKRDGGLKENSVALTFDDGFSSLYDIVFPILKRYGRSATVYLATDWINGKMSLWWEDLADIILGFDTDEKGLTALKRVGEEMNIEPLGDSPDDIKSRMKFLHALSHEFMKISDERKREIMDVLNSALSIGTPPQMVKSEPLTWEQIAEMAENGIMFGAHTCSHPNLSYVDMETARDEIARSREEIENRLNREIKGFAYPYGYDVAGYARFVPLLEELGFDYACMSWWGNNTDNSNLFQLYRNHLPSMKSKALLRRELYVNLTE